MEGEGEIGFQEYFVGRHHDVAITGVRFAGVERPARLPASSPPCEAADVVVIAPSNPIVSIGPIVAVPGVRASSSRPGGRASSRCRPSSPARH